MVKGLGLKCPKMTMKGTRKLELFRDMGCLNYVIWKYILQVVVYLAPFIDNIPLQPLDTSKSLPRPMTLRNAGVIICHHLRSQLAF